MTRARPLPTTDPALTFTSLFDYPDDRFRRISPHGDIGILTLWTKLDRAIPRLEAIAPEALDPDGRVAVISQFYGGGFQQLLCNLLHNPQIRHLIAIGQDLADQGLRVCEELEAALTVGLEEIEVLGVPSLRVVGRAARSRRSTASTCARSRGASRSTARRAGSPIRAGRGAAPPHRRAAASPAPTERGPRIVPPTADELPRTTRLPGERTAQQVVGERPLQVWGDLVVRTMRFGEPIELRKGPRIELLGAKAVILDPDEDSPQALRQAGFSSERFAAYQRAILDPALPEGVGYTYGNRLRGHFAASAPEGLGLGRPG